MRFLASSSRARIVAAALAAAAAVVLAGCSPAPSSTSGGASAGPSGTTGAATSAAGDITPYCPSEPTKIVFIKSAGGQVWSAIANAEFEAEAAKCPNIQASWYNGTSGVQGAIAATNAAVAQGAKALVVIADFGAAQLSHINLYDKTVEGLTLLDVPGGTVQYHPEAGPGPHDSLYLFDRFLEQIRAAA